MFPTFPLHFLSFSVCLSMLRFYVTSKISSNLMLYHLFWNFTYLYPFLYNTVSFSNLSLWIFIYFPIFISLNIVSQILKEPLLNNNICCILFLCFFSWDLFLGCVCVHCALLKRRNNFLPGSDECSFLSERIFFYCFRPNYQVYGSMFPDHPTRSKFLGIMSPRFIFSGRSFSLLFYWQVFLVPEQHSHVLEREGVYALWFSYS